MGGAEHNTGDCKKYNLDGTLKKGFAGKNTQGNLHNGSTLRKQNTSYAQLSGKITKLEKSSRKLKRASKKRNRNYNSKSDDSSAS